jgi:uncharacterized protein
MAATAPDPSSTPAAAGGPRREPTIAVAGGPEVLAIEVRGGRPGHTLAVVAGVHGDEVECIAALEDWVADVHLDAGTVLAIPVANPAALAIGTRLGPDGVDLNRVAPGDAAAVGDSLRLAAALHGALRTADAVVTLHSWSRSGETVPYVEFPAAPASMVATAARELALALGLPWAEPWVWPRGLLPAALVRDGVPAVEVEIGGLGRTTVDGHAIGLQVLDRAVRHLGLRGGGAPPGSTEVVERHWLTAPVDGRVRHSVPLGRRLAAGDPVVAIRNDRGRVAATLEAPTDGVMAIHVTYGHVKAGDPVAVVFTPARLD